MGADVKADMFNKARAEYEEKLASHETEKDSLRRSSRQSIDMASQTQKKLEMQVAALELDVTKKQQEADEWQEVAMNTKRDAEMSSKKVMKMNQDLEAEIATLQATKAAMQREADVKAESVARAKSISEEKISELEAKNEVLKHNLEEEKRSISEMERKMIELKEDRDGMAHEAEEWQEVAMNTKREGEEKVQELNKRFSRMSVNKDDNSESD